MITPQQILAAVAAKMQGPVHGNLQVEVCVGNEAFYHMGGGRFHYTAGFPVPKEIIPLSCDIRNTRTGLYAVAEVLLIKSTL